MTILTSLPDGGGIRGYASLLILQELMREILVIEHELDDLDDSRDDSGSHSVAHRLYRDNELPLPCHYFSYVFGTSTGGIIALLLGRMRLSVPQCLEIYSELGTEIFRKKRAFGMKFDQYSHTKLEKIVKKTLVKYCRHLEVSDMDDEAEKSRQENHRSASIQSNSLDTKELEDLDILDVCNVRKQEVLGFQQCRV